VTFWNNRRVFVTGHTGFKGSWLTCLLEKLGAQVTGYALAPLDPSLFALIEPKLAINSTISDIRNGPALTKALVDAAPEVLFHLAAQPLVRESYQNPIETYETNVMGTAQLLNAARAVESIKAIVIITSDKCYENRETSRGYREDDPMGGYDPYSSSKGCVEILTASFRRSFFNTGQSAAVATARAGNVIGGGDWSTDRLMPDLIHGILNNEKVMIRSPAAVRPWQHVLEPLSGYLNLAEHLLTDGADYATGWNFGPGPDDAKTVEWVVQFLQSQTAFDYGVEVADQHEANYLSLDSSKVQQKLAWTPKTNIEWALDKTLDWYTSIHSGADAKAKTDSQIEEFLAL